MKKNAAFLLLLGQLLFLANTGLAGLIGDLYMAKYEDHSISIEVDVGLMGNACRLYIDGTLIGEEKVFTIGHPKSLRSRINNKEVLVSVNQGLVGTDVKLFIDGTEMPLRQQR
ncbi:hypothetical protein [Candidatus Magnetaquicoccus inordinatus]|uniref:hypothetical protein n=1 Tax=Candidatus Magnetaquicoccus inordinatus TaxID=2496818 RepID=UPI00102B2128|nr:hypothetical protein [Candidatus Magnetaquicoccus inordinatus]